MIAVWLFLFFLLFYTSTAKGFLIYGDDISMYQVTRSIVQNHRLDVPPKTPGSTIGLRDHWYSKYGVGQSLLAIPFYFSGEALQQIRPSKRVVDNQGFVRANDIVYIVSFLGIVCTAATATLLYLVCRELGFRSSGSVVAAFAFGLGTFAWYYSRTFMTEPTNAFSLFASFYAMLRWTRRGETVWLLISGCFAGLCVLIRAADAVVLLPLALWLLWRVAGSLRRNIGHAAIKLVIWALPILAAAALVAAYDLVRFGDVLQTGYGSEANAFTTPLLVGLDGLLLSPGKSVFEYAPLLLAGVFGWFHLRRSNPAAATVAAAVVLLYLLIYAQWYQWYGGGAWGPRFLVVILPFGMIGVGAIVDRGLSFMGWIAFAALGALSFTIQAVSVLVPYVPYEGKMEASPVLFNDMLWNPAYSPVVAQARNLLHHQYPLDLAPAYYASPLLTIIQLLAFLVAIVILLLGMPMALELRRAPGRLRERSKEPSPVEF